MSLIFSFTKESSKISGSSLVIFSSETSPSKKESQNPTPKLFSKELSKDSLSFLQEMLTGSCFSGKLGETLFFRKSHFLDYENTLFVGLGRSQDLSHENIRRASSFLLKALKKEESHSFSILIDSLAPKINKDFLNAFFEGLYLTDYSFDDYKTAPKKNTNITIHIKSSQKSYLSLAQNTQKESQALCESVYFTRWLGDMPGNLMNPPILANEIKKITQDSKIKVEIWDEARIKKEKMGALLSVSKGGGTEPRFIIMKYNGATKTKKPLCFVGKGITFDSGGISIKPSASMEEMKFDMQGGAAVVGALLAISRLKLKVNAIGIISSSENMPGPNANKPGDIVTARNGKTIEVNNTDAEGRLVLSDALVYASEQKPQFIVDAATLTGAMVIALGDTHTGCFARNQSLLKNVKKASEKSGELIWEMPIHSDHLKDMKGSYADLQNVSGKRTAGSATAAAFLSEFVDESIPWVHFDIAGTAWNNGHRLPYASSKGASGVLVRTFVELARLYE